MPDEYDALLNGDFKTAAVFQDCCVKSRLIQMKRAVEHRVKSRAAAVPGPAVPLQS